MKVFILALFSLIVAVNSESKNLKTTDQKSQNSAFLQKFLPPLNHDVNQRYGSNGISGEELLRNILRDDHNKYYDYVDDHDDDQLSHDGKLRGLYNQPNIWGYSSNGGLGNLVSHSYNGDQNVWGYLRNSDGRLRNTGGQVTPRPEPRLEPRSRLGRVPLNRLYPSTMGPEILGHANIRQGHRSLAHENIRLEHIVRNLQALLEPRYIGYYGQVDPHKRGLKERYNFAMVTGRDLRLHGLDGRVDKHHGLSTPLPLLELAGRKHHGPHHH